MDKLAHFGGVFAFLVFWHFFADWVIQSHEEAMRKSWDHITRAMHCAMYTVAFVPFMVLSGFTNFEGFLCMGILFGVHFIEDTYIPVALWAKYIRRAPHFWELIEDEETGEYRLPTLMGGLKSFVEHPLGLLLAITIDQLVHIATLLPVAYYATY